MTVPDPFQHDPRTDPVLEAFHAMIRESPDHPVRELVIRGGPEMFDQFVRVAVRLGWELSEWELGVLREAFRAYQAWLQLELAREASAARWGTGD